MMTLTQKHEILGKLLSPARKYLQELRNSSKIHHNEKFTFLIIPQDP